MNSSQHKIAPMVESYFQKNISKFINNRIPGHTVCLYTDYENDYICEYTYFVGERVQEFCQDLSQNLSILIVLAQHYDEFTTTSGAMPEVCLRACHQI